MVNFILWTLVAIFVYITWKDIAQKDGTKEANKVIGALAFMFITGVVSNNLWGSLVSYLIEVAILILFAILIFTGKLRPSPKSDK